MPPRFFEEHGREYCEAGGRTFRVIDAGGQRWFMPVAILDSRLRERVENVLESTGRLFAELLEKGVPIEDARKVLPAGAMMNLEFESTFGEGEQLRP